MDSYNNNCNQNNYENNEHCTCGSCDYCLGQNNSLSRGNCCNSFGDNCSSNNSYCDTNNYNQGCCNVCGCNPCCCNTSYCNDCDSDSCDCDSNCCKGKNVIIDENAKSQVVCTNMDVIYDTCCALGTPLVITLDSVTDPDFVIDPMFKSCNYYNNCTVDDTSVFTVESSQVIVTALTPVDAIDPSEILINGLPVTDVVNVGNRYSAIINPLSVGTTDCSKNCPGTSSSLVINGIDNWEISLTIQVCGKVTTVDGTCKFNATITNAVPITNTTPVTFAVNDICIPPSNNNQGTNILFNIQACAQVINPVLTIPAPGESLTFSGVLLINTSAPVQITQNKPVCFYGYTCD